MEPLLPPLLSAAVLAAGMTAYADDLDRKPVGDAEESYPAIDDPGVVH